MPGTETLKRTPLHDRHVAAGARLVPGIARQRIAGGVVTNGTLSPALGIRTTELPAERGPAFAIDVRGTTRPADVRTKPLYVKET